MNTSPPPLPELRLHKVSLWASDQQQSGDALRTSILRMFHNHPASRLNQIGHEMMCRSGVVVERHLCTIRRPIEGLPRLGKDWKLILQPSHARIIARRLDLKASKSGSLLSTVCAVSWISNSIVKLKTFCHGYVTAWSVYISDHLAIKAQTVYTELSGMGTINNDNAQYKWITMHNEKQQQWPNSDQCLVHYEQCNNKN